MNYQEGSPEFDAVLNDREIFHKRTAARGEDNAESEENEKQGVMNTVLGYLRLIWQTRDTEETEENKELLIKTTLRELFIYILFIIILVILTYGMQSTYYFHFSETLKNQFEEPFMEVSDVEGFWSFLQESLIPGLYVTTEYNGMLLPELEENFYAYENKLLGVPRIRQVKVRNDSCVIPTDFAADLVDCFAEYDEGVEDKESFGLMNSTAWNYTDSKRLGNQKVEGWVTTYPAGGFYMDLNETADTSNDIINMLMSNLWITRGTRMIAVDFTIYNPNINMFCVAKFVAEMPATGGIMPFYELRVVKLLRYVSPSDYFVMACEFIFLVFIIYYCVEEILEIRKHKVSYFLNFWNILDVLVVLVGFVCSIFNVYRCIVVQQKLDGLLKDESKFPDFDFISFWQLQFDRAVAFLLFVAMIKFFKYISFNKTMTQLNATMEKCSQDLLGFALMFLIVFFAFGQLGYLLFGVQVDVFKDFITSIYTLFRIILGDFDFSQLDAANRILGPVYFISYVFFVFFVLINMFLAIINDSYAIVKEEMATVEDDSGFGDFFRQKAGFLMEKLRLKKQKVLDIQKAIETADVNGDGKLNFEELRQQLKERGFADEEINAVIAKYDKDGDNELDETERSNIRQDLETEKRMIAEEIDETEDQLEAVQKATPEQVDALQVKLSEMGDYVKDMTDQMNAVAQKLISMGVGADEVNQALKPKPSAARRVNMKEKASTSSGSGTTQSHVSLSSLRAEKPK